MLLCTFQYHLKYSGCNYAAQFSFHFDGFPSRPISLLFMQINQKSICPLSHVYSASLQNPYHVFSVLSLLSGTLSTWSSLCKKSFAVSASARHTFQISSNVPSEICIFVLTECTDRNNLCLFLRSVDLMTQSVSQLKVIFINVLCKTRRCPLIQRLMFMN